VQVRTDDEVYRVDAVWLGPPKATFPFRARYVAWGVGMLVFVLVLSGERVVGFGFGFFTVAWAVVATIVLTRLICSRISHERPLGAVFTMWLRELNTPRERPSGNGGATSATRVRIHPERPRPRPRRRSSRTAEARGPARPARSAQHVHYVPHAQNWAGRRTGGRGGRGGAVRPGNEEVGGVRTQGRT
jgi:hypothetical protein